MSTMESTQDLLTPIVEQEEETQAPAVEQEEETQAPAVKEPTRDLNEYAKEMTDNIEIMKKQIGTMKDEELSMLIEQNKVCTAMFKQVFAILVTEQVKRINPTTLSDVINTDLLGTEMEE